MRIGDGKWHPRGSLAAQDAARDVGLHDVPRRGGYPPALVRQVGSTKLKFLGGAIDDLHAMLKAHGDWMDLGAADEQKDAKPGTVEAWGRDASNPVAAGTGCARATEGGSRCTCRRCSKRSAWSS